MATIVNGICPTCGATTTVNLNNGYEDCNCCGYNNYITLDSIGGEDTSDDVCQSCGYEYCACHD